MYIETFVVIIGALVLYAIGYYVGHNEAEKKAQEEIDRLFTKIVGYRRLLIAIKKMVSKKQDVSGLSEADADYFAELTTEDKAEGAAYY